MSYDLFDEGTSKFYYVGIINNISRRAQEHFTTEYLNQNADMYYLERDVTYGEARG